MAYRQRVVGRALIAVEVVAGETQLPPSDREQVDTEATVPGKLPKSLHTYTVQAECESRSPPGIQSRVDKIWRTLSPSNPNNAYVFLLEGVQVGINKNTDKTLRKIFRHYHCFLNQVLVFNKVVQPNSFPASDCSNIMVTLRNLNNS